MKKLYMLILITLSLYLYPEDKVLYIDDIVNLVLKNNTTIKFSEINSELSLNIYNQVIGLSKPEISFMTDTITTPLAGYNNYTSGVDTFTFSSGLNYSQLLPTGGSFDMDLYDEFTMTNSDSEIDWEQTPGVTISYYQPILANGKFIDTKAGSNSKRVGEITYIISQIEDIETKNQIILGILSSIHSLNTIKGNIQILEKNIQVNENDVSIAQEERLAGRISSTELINKELGVSKLKNNLFDLEYQKTIFERNLKGVMGLDNISNIEFIMDFKTQDEYKHNGFEKQKAQLQLEQSRLTSKQNRVSEAPILSLSMTTESNDLFSDDDLDFTFDLKVGFELSLFDGAIRKNKREADKKLEEISLMNLSDIDKSQQESIDNLIIKKELLERKIEFLLDDINYNKIILQREREMLELGVSTPQSIELIEIDIQSKENDLKIIKEELTIDELNLLNLKGINLEEVFR